MRRNRIVSFMICINMLFPILVPFTAVGADEGEVKISSAKDFAEFSKKCMLDSYSKGLTVSLMNDISLNGMSFSPVPYFAGRFEGNGHTIKDITYFKNGSYIGLFRRIAPGATVRDLSVEMNISPGGHSSHVGGIAGENAGSILSCSFSGSLNGSGYTGGIAGENLSDGIISDCISEGTVFGEHYAGGICAYNSGRISGCKNSAAVNDKSVEITLDIEKLDFKKLLSTTNTVDITDIGGIAGYSSGIVEGCENEGTVGYNHIGYNIGGICGRQSGYLNNSKNSGKIFGRKDVGGIVGQMEYYTSVKYSADSVNSLINELDRLTSMTDSLISKSNAYQSNTSSRLGGLKAYADSAISDANILKDKTKDILDENVDSINDTGTSLSETVGEICDAIDKNGGISDEVNAFTNGYADIIDKIDGAVDIDSTDARKALDSLAEAAKDFDGASGDISKALSKIQKSVYDAEDMFYSINALGGQIKRLVKIADNMKDDLDTIDRYLNEAEEKAKAGNIPDAAEEIRKTRPRIESFVKEFRDFSSRLSYVNDELKYMGGLLENADIGNIGESIDKLADATDELSKAFSNLSDATEIIDNNGSTVDTDALSGIGQDMRAANSHLDKALGSVSSSVSDISDSLSEYSQKPVISIKKTDPEYTQTADSLSDNIAGIADTLDSINNGLSADLGNIFGDMKGINDQVYVVFDKMASMIDRSVEDIDIDDYITDVSEEDTVNQTTGKVSKSINYGRVSADLNVGGIAGAMAVEYDFDPEDDIHRSGEKTRNFLYTLRAIIRECENKGNVAAKKNCAGGIVGYQALGCVISSSGGGYVESSGGDYVGGIAGLSEATVKNCNSKANLSGDDYIGGICGKAQNIYDCRSAAAISGADEYKGAICGDTGGNVLRNYFCSDTLGGIDSTSYVGIAEPRSIDELIAIAPDFFKTYHADFYIDDKLIKSVEYEYGQGVDPVPRIPDKDGMYGKWDIDEFNGLTHDIETHAEYYPYILSIEANTNSPDEPAKVICEGKFKEGELLKCVPSPAKGYKLKAFEKYVDSFTVKTSDNSEISAIRYYTDGKKKNISVFFIEDGKRKRAHYKKDGSYIVFDTGRVDADILIVKDSSIPKTAAYMILSAIILLALGMGVLRIRKVKKQGKVVK